MKITDFTSEFATYPCIFHAFSGSHIKFNYFIFPLSLVLAKLNPRSADRSGTVPRSACWQCCAYSCRSDRVAARAGKVQEPRRSLSRIEVSGRTLSWFRSLSLSLSLFLSLSFSLSLSLACWPVAFFVCCGLLFAVCRLPRAFLRFSPVPYTIGTLVIGRARLYPRTVRRLCAHHPTRIPSASL